MQFEAIDDFFTVLDNTTVDAQGSYRQRAVNWTRPLQLKQFSVLVTGYSGDCTRLSTLFMRYQRLGYKLSEPSAT